jgi:hypothetical protein
VPFFFCSTLRHLSRPGVAIDTELLALELCGANSELLDFFAFWFVSDPADLLLHSYLCHLLEQTDHNEVVPQAQDMSAAT